MAQRTYEQKLRRKLSGVLHELVLNGTIKDKAVLEVNTATNMKEPA